MTKKETMWRGMIMVIVGAVVAAAAGADFYVDRLHGSDSNNGQTPATAKKTIAAGLALAAANDQVLLLPGEYTEVFTVPVGVTLRGLGEAVISVPQAYPQPPAYVQGTVQDLTFKSGSQPLYASGSSPVLIVNCRFVENCSERGALFLNQFSPSGVVVRNCLFLRNTYGLYDSTGVNPTVEHCTFYGNTIVGLTISGGAIRNDTFVGNMQGIGAPSGYPVTYYCHFHGNGQDAPGVTNNFPNFDEPKFLDPAHDVYLLQTDSPLLAHGQGGCRIGAYGLGFVGSKGQTPPFDEWIDANGSALSASTLVELNPDNEVVLKAGVDSAAIYSPVYNTGSQWTAIRSVGFGAFEDITLPTGQRQIIDADPNTPERETRIRTAATSFSQDPQNGPSFEIVHKHQKFEKRAQFVQMELVLRRNGY